MQLPVLNMKIDFHFKIYKKKFTYYTYSKKHKSNPPFL